MNVSEVFAYGLAHFNLGVLLLQAGRLEEALVPMAEACRILPGRADVLLAAGEAAAVAGEASRAIEWLAASAELTPEEPAALVLLGKLHGAAGDYASAAESFRAALERNPDDIEARQGLRRAESLR